MNGRLKESQKSTYKSNNANSQRNSLVRNERYQQFGNPDVVNINKDTFHTLNILREKMSSSFSANNPDKMLPCVMTMSPNRIVCNPKKYGKMLDYDNK